MLSNFEKIGVAFAGAAALACVSVLVEAGCSSDGNLTPQAQQALTNMNTVAKNVVTAFCKVDGVAQPLAVVIAPAVAPQVAPLVGTDEALIHPVVLAACSAISGVPVGTASTPAPAAVTVPAGN